MVSIILAFIPKIDSFVNYQAPTRVLRVAAPFAVPSVEQMIVPYLPPKEEGDGPTRWTKPSSRVSIYTPSNAANPGKSIVFLGGYVVSTFPTYFYKDFVENIAERTGRTAACVQYDSFSDGASGFGNHRRSAEVAMEVCGELEFGGEVDIVAHSLGCKIASIMIDEGLESFKDGCRCVFVSPNNQELDGSLDYVLGVLRKLGGAGGEARLEQTFGTLKTLLRGVGGFLKFNPDRQSFWSILRRAFQERKGSLKMISLEGEGEEGLDEAFEWVCEIGKEEGVDEAKGTSENLLEGVVDLHAYETSDGTIVASPGVDGGGGGGGGGGGNGN